MRRGDMGAQGEGGIRRGRERGCVCGGGGEGGRCERGGERTRRGWEGGERMRRGRGRGWVHGKEEGRKGEMVHAGRAIIILHCLA